MAQKMKHTLGDRLNIRFNRKIRLEFHGARLTSDGGLLAYRELDEALGLFESTSAVMNDRRTGRNIQHDITNLLRQSVYSRLAGYEDVNDAQRLSVDPVMRAVTGKKKNAASINTIGRFETEILTLRITLKVCLKLTEAGLKKQRRGHLIIELFLIWTVQKVRYMESRRGQHTMVTLDPIAIILCFVLTSMATARERCCVQVMSTVLTDGRIYWNQSFDDTKTKK